MSLGGQLPCRSGLWHASCPSYGTILYRVVFVRRRISHVGVLALVVASCHGGSAAKTTSRTDNQWSALGKAGLCPNGTDFFGTWLITEVSGNPGPTRFYSYYPAMAREPDGVTCWGRYGDGSETYVPPLTLSLGAWHHVEFWVKLNTPGQSNASQTFWLDGVQRGNWAGFSFRASTILRLNAVQFSFSGNPTGTTRTLYVDHLIVTTARPAP